MNLATVAIIHWMSQISMYVLICVSTYLDFNADISSRGSCGERFGPQFTSVKVVGPSPSRTSGLWEHCTKKNQREHSWTLELIFIKACYF